MMKGISAVVLLTLLLSVPAVAMPLRDAYLLDTGYFAPGQGMDGSHMFGGPGGYNMRGHAFQFYIDKSSLLKGAFLYLTINPVIPYPKGLTPESEFSLAVYEKTLNHEYWGIIPDTTSLLKRSNKVKLEGEGEHEVYAGGLDLLLDPGIYWLGIEGDGALTYINGFRLDKQYAAVPVPSTVLLLLSGLSLLWRKRKQA